MTILLLGLGNRDRGDDAVGLQVAARVAARLGLPLASEGVAGSDAAAAGDTVQGAQRDAAALDGPAAGPVTVATWSGPDLDLLDRWDGHDHVVVVDASRGAGPPGTRRRVVVNPEAVAHGGRPTGSHAMGLPRVIALGHALGRLPGCIELATIEAGSVTAGTDLTRTVAVAAGRLVDDLVAEFGGMRPGRQVEEVHRVPG